MAQANPLFPVKEQFPILDKDTSADIVIIGAGIAGISSAYHLAIKGYKVVVLEEQEIGAGATSASSGILYYGTGTDLVDSINLYGKENAEMLWEESKESIGLIEKIIEKDNLSCDLRKPGALIVAKNEEEQEFLEKELACLKSIGFQGELLQRDEIKNYYTGKEFLAALKQDSVIQIAPALYTVGLAKIANIEVYNSSPLISYKEENNSIIVETPKAKIKTQKLLFATNRKPFFGLEKNFFIENSVILASKKLSEAQIKAIWPEHKIIWTLEDKYDIIYEHDSRAILELYYFKGAKDKIKYYYENLDFMQEHTWGDSWSKTKDLLPIAGRIKDNVFAAIAMGDQGIVVGFTVGRKIVDIIEEKSNPFLELISPKRFGNNI